MEASKATQILQLLAAAEAAREPVDMKLTAKHAGLSNNALRLHIEWLEQRGLVLSGLQDGQPPLVLDAGHQYLARGGDVNRSILEFLPHTIDDLDARSALLTAGIILIDEFRAAILAGDPVDHARQIVPAAFAPAVTDRIAVDLFAAAVALIARLSDERPAGCVAEEVLAVALITEARALLELEREAGTLVADEFDTAADALRGLFELFQDDDVLHLYDMREPADAAVAGASDISIQLGVVDQRLEAWFEPFGWTAPTGYLNTRSDAADDI